MGNIVLGVEVTLMHSRSTSNDSVPTFTYLHYRLGTLNSRGRESDRCVRWFTRFVRYQLSVRCIITSDGTQWEHLTFRTCHKPQCQHYVKVCHDGDSTTQTCCTYYWWVQILGWRCLRIHYRRTASPLARRRRPANIPLNVTNNTSDGCYLFLIYIYICFFCF